MEVTGTGVAVAQVMPTAAKKEVKPRPCKFGGGPECLSSDRARVDCHVCGTLRDRLSGTAAVELHQGGLRKQMRGLEERVCELEAELFDAVGRLRRLQAENQRLREKGDQG